MPFDLVQQRLLTEELDALKAKERELAEASAEIESLMESLSEENKEQLLNEANDAFVPAEITKALKQAYTEIETPEIVALNEYLEFLGTDPKPKKPQKSNLYKRIQKCNGQTLKPIKMALMQHQK